MNLIETKTSWNQKKKKISVYGNWHKKVYPDLRGCKRIFK